MRYERKNLDKVKPYKTPLSLDPPKFGAGNGRGNPWANGRHHARFDVLKNWPIIRSTKEQRTRAHPGGAV